jgi:polysaccharide biosynthesis protein PslA
MDDTMSRIGPSLRNAVLRSPHLSAVGALDGGGPPIPATATAAALLAVDLGVYAAAPALAARLMADAPELAVVQRVTLMLMLLAVPLALAAGSYGRCALFRPRRQLRGVLGAAAAAGGVVALALALFAPESPGHPLWAIATAALLLGGLTAGRLAAARAIARHPRRRFAPRTVIVGNGLGGTRLARLLTQFDHQSVRLLGMVDDHLRTADELIDDVPYLGPIGQVFALVRRGVVDEVVLALPWSEEERILDLIANLADYPVHVRLAPDLISHHFPRRAQLDAHGHPVLHVADRPISGWASVVKRAEDLLVGSLALAICAIPMAVMALLIRLDSPGPVLFRQRRTGFNNQDFEMLKFRTMHHHMAEYTIRQQTQKDDKRVTRIGALLRRTSLDELPQIFNVLRGEMSIVGPRPHAPGTRAGSRTFEEVVERYAARHRVKPGLTGLAQVRGYRGETRTEEKLVQRVASDLEYIESWSPWLDFVILLRTAVIVTLMKNAY